MGGIGRGKLRESVREKEARKKKEKKKNKALKNTIVKNKNKSSFILKNKYFWVVGCIFLKQFDFVHIHLALKS